MMKNTAKTAILLAALGALFMAIGSFWGQGGLVIGLVLGLVFVGGSYWFSDKLAVKAARAQPLPEDQHPEIHAMVAELAQRANIPKPRVYWSPNPQPNAFATGRNERKAVVAVTDGLLQVMDRHELEGVLAHEISHVKHRDILIGSVAAAAAMGITFAARMAMWGALLGGGRDRNAGNAIGAIAMMILAPLAAMLIQAALSRSREFEADRGGAALVGSGEPLARALEKLDAYSKRVPMDVDPAQATAYIVNPLAGRKANFAGLFSTHPPTEARVARLRAVDGITR